MADRPPEDKTQTAFEASLRAHLALPDEAMPDVTDAAGHRERINVLALDAFGGRDEVARTWLTTPHPLLEGETPLARCQTEAGLREVEDLLTVIDETSAA